MKKSVISRVLGILLLLAGTVQAFGQAQLLPPAEQCFQANTGINGMVGVLGTITPGSLYTSGTYGGVPLTGGSGTNATANITVAGGVVTVVTIVNPGIQYVVGDVLSASAVNIGGTGSGFSVVVTATSINSSLAGGSVGYYIPNTLTFKNTWQDAGQTILNTNPVQLNQNGCAIVYGSGSYRQILKDSLGNTIWDQVTSDYSSTGSPFWAGLAGGTPDALMVVDTSFSGTDGQSISFKVLSTNTGAATLDVSNFGAIPILKETNVGPVSLTGGELVAGNIIVVTYDSSLVSFQIIQGAQEPNTTSTIIAYGQAQFRYISSISAQLCPYNGNKVTFPSGNIAEVPSTCYNANPTATTIDGTPGALSVSTRYYAYLWNSSGTTYSIDFSSTGHSPDTATGIEIKTGDPSRVFIGMVYTVTGPNFADSNSQRLVATWFNRSTKSLIGTFTVDRTTTSTSLVEINTEIRVQFLTWGGAVNTNTFGVVLSSTNNQIISTDVTWDGIANIACSSQIQLTNGGLVANPACSGNRQDAEGFHYATIAGAVSVGTGTWKSGYSLIGNISN